MADIQVNIGLKSGNGNYILKKQRINSIHSLSQSNSDASTIFYGTLSNTGSIEISDKNGEIKNLIELGEIGSSNVNIDIFANNQKVQNHKTNNSMYEDNILLVNVDNSLNNISNLIYESSDESGYLRSIDAYSLLVKICENSKPSLQIPDASYSVMVNNSVESKTFEDLLKNITIEDIDLGELNKYSTQQLLSYFCQLTQSNIFYDKNGNLKIIPSRPINKSGTLLNGQELGSFVPNKCVFESGQTSLFLNNKINKINLNLVSGNVDNVIMENFNKHQHSSDTVLDKQNYLDAVCFNKFNTKDMVQEFDFNTSSIIFYSIDVELDYYIKQDLSSMGYTVALLNMVGNDIYYPTDTSGQNIVITNEPSISVFKEKALSYLNSNPLAIFSCAFCEYMDNIYTKKYKILCAVRGFASQSVTFWIVHPPRIGANSYDKKELNIFEKQYSYADDSFASDNVLKFDSNPLFTENSKINIWGTEYYLYDYFIKNIFSDYAIGIKTKTVTVSCSNYLDKNQVEISKNFKKGDIFEVGDIVTLQDEKYVNGNLIEWKITGVDFVYDGSPMLKLQLQECLKVVELDEFKYGLYKDEELIYSWGDLKARGLVGVNGSELSFVNNSLEGELIIPSSITVIGSSAFSGCSNITNINIPDSVNYIDSYAFRYSGISNANISDNVTFIGKGAFLGCKNLEYVSLSQNIDTISKETFSGCFKLKNITIPKNVREIKDHAFFVCSSLNNVDFSQSVMISTIGEGAFSNCTALKTINLPDSLTTIKQGAFAYSGIETISVGNGLVNLETRAFDNCVGLTSLLLPESTVSISKGALCGCQNIKTLQMPADMFVDAFYDSNTGLSTNNVENIILIGFTSINRNWSIRGNSKIKTLYIPNSIKDIKTGIWYEQPQQRPFIGCSPLLKLYCEPSSDLSGWGAYWNAYSYTVQSNGTPVYSLLETIYSKSLEYYKSIIGLS